MHPVRGGGATTRGRRRLWAAAVGALVGLVVGLGVGWLVVRPSDDDLLAAAEGLVPDGFTVQGSGVDQGLVLLGWPDVAGLTATRPGAGSQDVSVPGLAEAAGWTVADHTPSDHGDRASLRRPGLAADVSLSAGDGGAEIHVTVLRDGSTPWRVGVPAGLGAVAGGLVAGLGARRRSPSP